MKFAAVLVVIVSGTTSMAAGAVETKFLRVSGSSVEPVKAKKRAPVPEVAPVVVGSLAYRPIRFGKARGLGQNGGDLAVIDVATGKELYTIRVYSIEYRPDFEGDKQDNFISEISLERDGTTLLVRDERGHRYRVDTKTGKVVRSR